LGSKQAKKKKKEERKRKDIDRVKQRKIIIIKETRMWIREVSLKCKHILFHHHHHHHVPEGLGVFPVP